MATQQRNQNRPDRNKDRGKEKPPFKDKNKDGIPDRDVLSAGVLTDEYAVVAPLILNNPELRQITEQATSDGWFDTPEGVAKYKLAIQNSDFWKTNNQYARAAWAMFQQSQQGQGADWKTLVEDAKLAVQARATDMGAAIDPTQLDNLANRYIYEGWGEAQRADLLDRALAESVTYQPTEGGGQALRGEAGNLAIQLRQAAYENGITYADNFFQEAAQSVALGLKTADDWMTDIREQAAGRYPVFADKIRAGVSARALASPYMQIMSNEFEISPQDIDLSDSYIAGALGGFSPDGSAQAENLWDFTKRLRRDPRWMNTSKAQNEITGTVGRVMQMFGVMGG